MDTINIFSTDLRGKVKKEYTSIPGVWVVFYDDTTFDTLKKIEDSAGDDKLKSSMMLLQSQIESWNFADKKGKLPISVESLQRLPTKLLKWLSDTSREVLNPEQIEKEKKNSPAI